MILNLIQILTFFFHTMASESIPSCDSKKLNIIAYYGEKGEHKSPLLETWSEVSGDIKKIELKTKDKISSLKLIFLDDQQKEVLKKNLMLKNNSTDAINFIQNYKIEITKTKTLKLIAQIQNIDFCHNNVTIIQADGEGPAE